MKKSVKILLTVSVLLILIGSAMMAGAWFAMANRPSEEMAAIEFVENTHTITENFSDIILNTQSSSIEILHSPDGVCRIVCDDSEKLYHKVSFQKSDAGTVLYIAQHSELQWYETLWGFHWQEDPVLSVYLPKSEYGVVDAASGSGDISIAPDFCFTTLSTSAISGNTKLSELCTENLQAYSSSGDISIQTLHVEDSIYLENVSGFTRAEDVSATQITTSASSDDTVLEGVSSDYLHATAVSGEIRVMGGTFRDTSYFETSSGSIEISDSECGELTVQAVSGSVTLQNVRGPSLNAGTSSGDVSLWDTLYSGNVLCHTTSGAVQFTGLDGENLEFITSSGDVSGNLLSAKNFITETSSGYVSVPPSDETAGTCHISTVSGSINIAIKP